jgi:hypothetical protein
MRALRLQASHSSVVRYSVITFDGEMELYAFCVSFSLFYSVFRLAGRPIPAALPRCAHLQRNGLQSYSFPATNQNFSRTFVSKNRFLSAIPPEFGSRHPLSAPFVPSMRGFARARCELGLRVGMAGSCRLVAMCLRPSRCSSFGLAAGRASARAKLLR